MEVFDVAGFDKGTNMAVNQPNRIFEKVECALKTH